MQEFINSKILYKVVESDFGNFVLQNTLESYSKCQDTNYDLIDAITDCILDISQFKLQQKWGNEILIKHLQDTKNPRVAEILNKLE